MLLSLVCLINVFRGVYVFWALRYPYVHIYIYELLKIFNGNFCGTRLRLRQTLRQLYAQLTPTLKIKVFHLGCAILRQTYAQLTPNQLDCNLLTPNLTPTLRPAYADP